MWMSSLYGHFFSDLNIQCSGGTEQPDWLFSCKRAFVAVHFCISCIVPYKSCGRLIGESAFNTSSVSFLNFCFGLSSFKSSL